MNFSKKNPKSIESAKEQIENAVKAYLTKDKNGDYLVPIEKQRPIILMGPPGIGKTAIMNQIAIEMGIGFLSYSMTHHTRQSALGLPVIKTKKYNDNEFEISEYTMSEIISAIYERMEQTGDKEGILFLDEINCVSETLAPVMLKFLQYKEFGMHKVPEGWIVVTAGNPPEYNNSVREFDIVTWDRLKRIDVEPDLEAWIKYASAHQVHPAVLSYLEIKNNDFYSVETLASGKSFVTARGWDDLAQMIRLYEIHNIRVDEMLVRQYLQNEKIAKNFAEYYDLFNKYKSDYQIDNILNGKVSKEIKERARRAEMDERISLTSLLFEAISNKTRDIMTRQAVLSELQEVLKKFKEKSADTSKRPSEHLALIIDEKNSEIETGKQTGNMFCEDISIKREIVAVLEKEKMAITGEYDPEKAFSLFKKDYNAMLKELKVAGQKVSEKMDNVFLFSADVFSTEREILLLVTEISSDYYSAKFIAEYGSVQYFRHNKSLLIHERQKELITSLEDLNID